MRKQFSSTDPKNSWRISRTLCPETGHTDSLLCKYRESQWPKEGLCKPPGQTPPSVFGSCWEHHQCSTSSGALRPGKPGQEPDQQHAQPGQTHMSPLPPPTNSSILLSKHTCTRLANLLLSLKRENPRTSPGMQLHLLPVFNSFAQINPLSSTRV